MNFLNKRVRDLSPRAEFAEVTTISLAILAVTLALPLLLRAFPSINVSDQWIMGPIVNCALIIAGMNMRGRAKVAAVTVLPSVVHIANFYLFAIGGLYSLYMLPAMWLGNAAVVFGYKYFYTHKRFGFAFTSVIAVGVKVMLIFGTYLALVGLNVIPETAGLAAKMGINQILVAVIGCVAAFVVLRLFYRPNARRV